MGIPMDRSDFDVDAVWAYLLYTCPALVEQLEVIDLRLSAARISRELGFNSSSRLEDWLQRNSLPRFALLKDWYYVTALHRAAQSGVTLSRAATMQGRYVSILSRFVLRVTGESWRELRTSSSRTFGVGPWMCGWQIGQACYTLRVLARTCRMPSISRTCRWSQAIIDLTLRSYVGKESTSSNCRASTRRRLARRGRCQD